MNFLSGEKILFSLTSIFHRIIIVATNSAQYPFDKDMTRSMNETLLSLRCLRATCPAVLISKWLTKETKIQPTAVPLDTLPERCTMTMHHEISARGLLMPAGDGSAMLSDTLSRQDSEGEKSRPLDHMRQIPFVGISVPPY